MTTATTARVGAFYFESLDHGARCWGVNHKDTGTLGHCTRCRAEVVEVVKNGKAFLATMFTAGKYDARTYYCWQRHTCDPQRVAQVAADKAANLASGVLMKGATVVVARGRKVPKGTTGTVIWMGEDNWGKGRLGLKDAEGTVHWTASANVDVVAPEMPLEPAECEGHPDGPEMGVTFYCDGTCNPDQEREPLVTADEAAGRRLKSKHDYECVTWATFTKGLTEVEAEAGLADGTVTCMCRSTRGRRY
jgi:hypothetical protein